MSNKLTEDAIIKSFLSAGCRVSFSTSAFGVTHSIDGAPEKISEAIASLVDAEKNGEIAELRQQLAAAQNDVKQLRQSQDKRASQLTMKIEVDKPRIITALEKCIQEISDTVDDANVSSDIDKPKASITQDAVSEVMAAMHEDESNSDGWIEWHGGSIPPIKNGIAHQVKFFCGEVSEIDYAASTWAWGRKSGIGSHTIVAYRLAK